MAIIYVRAGNLLGAKLGTTSVVGGLGTTAVVTTCAGSLVSACTGLGAGGVMVGSWVSACTGLGTGGITVGTASLSAAWHCNRGTLRIHSVQDGLHYAGHVLGRQGPGDWLFS